MNKEQNTSKTTEPAIAVDTVLATVDGLKYQLSNVPIKNGDLVYNEFAKTIDTCIQVFTDNSMCVQFKSGMRAVLSTRHYRRAILQ